MRELVKPQFHDSEVSKATDFSIASTFASELVNILLDGMYQDSTRNMILGGYAVSQTSPASMNILLTKGLAYNRTDALFLFLASDLVVPVSAAHATLARTDTLEVQYKEIDEDTEARTFKDPLNGTISTANVPTRKRITVQAKCLAGVAGSGVAPNTETGWVKIAEIIVGAGIGAIYNANIKPVSAEYSTNENSAWTAEKSTTFRLGSLNVVKNKHLEHVSDNVSSVNTVHGIRQGHGNGFDADTVDGSHYNASDILAKLKTVDGLGSGLDTESLGGVDHKGYMLRDSAFVLNAENITGGQLLTLEQTAAGSIGLCIIKATTDLQDPTDTFVRLPNQPENTYKWVVKQDEGNCLQGLSPGGTNIVTLRPSKDSFVGATVYYNRVS